MAEQGQFEDVYDQLRKLANAMQQSHLASPTLQPTDLVHEAYLRLSGTKGFEDRLHLLNTAVKAMRQILVDRARRRGAQKRGGEWHQVTLSGLHTNGNRVLDALAVEEVLTELENLEPRQAHLVELRVLGGLEMADIATIIGVSERTAASDWRRASAWLRVRMKQLD